MKDPTGIVTVRASKEWGPSRLNYNTFLNYTKFEPVNQDSTNHKYQEEIHRKWIWRHPNLPWLLRSSHEAVDIGFEFESGQWITQQPITMTPDCPKAVMRQQIRVFKVTKHVGEMRTTGPQIFGQQTRKCKTSIDLRLVHLSFHFRDSFCGGWFWFIRGKERSHWNRHNEFKQRVIRVTTELQRFTPLSRFRFTPFTPTFFPYDMTVSASRIF